MKFKEFLENKLLAEGQKDEFYRNEAKSIADRIIAFLDSSKARTEGLPFKWKPDKTKWGDVKFSLESVVPEHPKLKLGFKNTYLNNWGEYNRNVIYISLPSRTMEVAILDSGYGTPEGNRGIHPAVAKFLKKPDSYNTLIHEIIHYLDSKRTKGNVFKNYPSKWNTPEYYNHPAEINAWLQAFLVGLDRRSMSWEEIIKELKQEKRFLNLNSERKRRQAINRAYLWFNKDKNEIS